MNVAAAPTQGRTCPKCEPDNPAARYADTCVVHRVREGLPAHYFDCNRFDVTDYGTRQGTCDCTATADVEALLTLLTPQAHHQGAWAVHDDGECDCECPRCWFHDDCICRDCTSPFHGHDPRQPSAPAKDKA